MPTDASVNVRAGLNSRHRLKIGLFGANCSSGRAVTRIAERWSGSWADCKRLAQMADDAGIEFMLPIGRWKGYGGETDYQGATLETITWAAGLLAHTKRLVAFGTVHAPLIHPVVAAKAMVTADQIGEGRFGLNLVCGWNEDEFRMFGVQQRDHETRYDYAQEWLDAVKAMWSRGDEFDFDGAFIKLKEVRAKPKPVGGARPYIMNAGASPTGQAFAVRNCDGLFISTQLHELDTVAAAVSRVRQAAREHGREIEVFTAGVVTCRPTRKEAEEYDHYAVVENADIGAIDHILAMRDVTPDNYSAEEFAALRRRQAYGMGGVRMVGTPDDVATVLASLSDGGIAGVALSFVHYIDELPYFCAEVLPRLERLGLR
ncbi:MAG TPA: LLM class flavin-dependent oxidoreductase, partial [Stellaceae bacterium]|nr:LLM class flavin-dependent oxidoreductase [Stellaceae bacterium]